MAGVKAERPSSKGPPSESPKKVHFESKPDGPKRDWRKKKGFNEKHGKVPKPKPVEEDAEDDEEGEEDAMDEAVDDEEVAEDKQEKVFRPLVCPSIPSSPAEAQDQEVLPGDPALQSRRLQVRLPAGAGQGGQQGVQRAQCRLGG